MKLLIKILIIGTIVFNALTIKAQETHVFFGTILNYQDSTPIFNAHIINKNLNRGVVSDSNGKFLIQARDQDTLQASIIGFETKIIIDYSTTVIIYLKKKNYELESFTVLPYKDFQEFKEAFVDLKLKDDSPQVNESIFLSKEELKSYDGSSGAVGLISGILGHFNKYVQDKKNYNRLIKQDKFEALLAKKFTPQLVKNATHIKDSTTIQSFMEYCDFTNDFINHSSEYELSKQIIECYQEFNSLTTSNE